MDRSIRYSTNAALQHFSYLMEKATQRYKSNGGVKSNHGVTY